MKVLLGNNATLKPFFWLRIISLELLNTVPFNGNKYPLRLHWSETVLTFQIPAGI